MTLDPTFFDHDDDDDASEAFDRALFARRARALASSSHEPPLPEARAILARASRRSARRPFDTGAAAFVVAAAAALCLLVRVGAFDVLRVGGGDAGGASGRRAQSTAAVLRDPSAPLGTDDELARAPDPRDPLACWASDGPASVGAYASGAASDPPRVESARDESAAACVAQPASFASCSVE